MSDSSDKSVNAPDFERVIVEMTKALQAGEPYIAESEELYFKYAVYVMGKQEAMRLGSRTEYTKNTAGQDVVIDTYRGKNGAEFRVGYLA